MNTAAAVEVDEAAVPIGESTAALRRNWWKIAIWIVVVAAATYYVSRKLPSVYEATATLDIDRNAPAGVIGSESARETSQQDAEAFLTTQAELVQSDAVLRGVAGKLRHRDPAMVEAFRSPAPVTWTGLKVTRVPSTNLIRIAFRSSDPAVAADVANAIAESYVEHTYLLRLQSSADMTAFMAKQMEELRERMNTSGAALMQFEKELNVIDPEQRAGILSARLLQLNTEYTAAQAERMRKEAALDLVRDGNMEAAQVSLQGRDLLRMAERVDAARQEFAAAKATYGAKHPEYARTSSALNELQRQLGEAQQSAGRRTAADFTQSSSQEQRLRAAVAETKAEFDRIKSRSFAYQNLKRSADEDKRLYEELVRRIREAGINAGFRSGAIRIADAARAPGIPVFPNAKLNALLAAIAALIGGVIFVICRVALDRSIHSPEQIPAALNTHVVGVLPSVSGADKMRIDSPSLPLAVFRLRKQRSERGEQQLARYQEAIRTLRNWILLQNASLRSVLVTSAAAGEGKSTTACHLAVANAKHRRTLLIDADLRRGSLSRRFGVSSAPGLSNALHGGIDWQECVTAASGYENLDILPAGLNKSRASDLIGPRLRTILEQASEHYELLIIDAPPILGFAETLEIATAVDGVLLVSLFGVTDKKLVSSAVSTLGRLGARVLGVALNQTPPEAADSKPYEPDTALAVANGL